ncbi:MAG: hypothetical protein M3Q65_03380, partial [Chloroflexota bacterium]|nr:hypothetical protein [Chloroflexota bacterium]
MNGQAGPTGATDRERQRAALRWALADLEGLLARGVLDARAADRLRRDWGERLRRLDALPG